MIENCEFLLGQGRSIVIGLPQYLPVADNYTVSISPQSIRFIAGREKVAEIPYKSSEVFNRLSFAHEVGLVESRDGEHYPDYITNVAYIEVRKGETVQ